MHGLALMQSPLMERSGRTVAGARPTAPATWTSARWESRSCHADDAGTRCSPFCRWNQSRRCLGFCCAVVQARHGIRLAALLIRAPREDFAEAVDEVGRVDARRVLAERRLVLDDLCEHARVCACAPVRGACVVRAGLCDGSVYIGCGLTSIAISAACDMWIFSPPDAFCSAMSSIVHTCHAHGRDRQVDGR